jgi:hypothetical protein
MMIAVLPMIGGCSSAKHAAQPRATVTATVTEQELGTPAGRSSTRPRAARTPVVLRLRNGQQHFQTPSRNIDCYLLAFGGSRRVECSLKVKDFADPSRPEDCDVDWAPEFDLATHATYGTCRGDANEPQAPTELPYGTSAVNGPLVCTSQPTGLTCRNRDTTHGFVISREHFDTF